MLRTRGRLLWLTWLSAGLAVAMVVSLACGAGATPAPKPVATVAPTPTRAAPTPTSVVAEKPQYGGVLRYARNLDAKTLDTAFDQNAGSRAVPHIWLDTLVDIDPDLTLVPRLARSWKVSADGKAITFGLVQGAKFHDGTAFNAQAVKAHFDRLLDPDVASVHRGDIAIIDRVVADDANTVTLQLKQPKRTLLATLADYPGFIHSVAAINKANSYKDRTGAYGKSPVGTGPFKFKEWLPDSHITAEKFEGYWDTGKPYMDSIIYRHVPDASIQLAMVRTGEIDIIDLVADKDLPLVRQNPNLRIVQLPRGRIHFIGLSWEFEPWSNKALRQAFAYAVDRKTIANVYHLGGAEPAYSIAVGWAYNPDIKIYDYDVQKAKAKLTEAGYPNGITLPYPCSSTPAEIQRCEMIQAQLQVIGMNMQITPVIPADYFPNTVARKNHIAHRWRGPRGDPAIVLEQTFHSKGSGTIMGYNNPQVDKLLEDAAIIYDTAQAKKLYDQAQEIIVREVAAVFTVFTKETQVLNARVQNYKFIPDLYLRLYDLWLKK